MAPKKTTSTSRENAADQSDQADISFEDSLNELQRIVAELEDGKLSLGQSLEKYEAGVKNLKQCYAALAAAQQKIEVLVELDDDGQVVSRSFDSQATQPSSAKQASPKTPRRSRKNLGDEAEQLLETDDDSSLF